MQTLAKFLDDAQGYGYKTRQKAMVVFNYRKKSKKEIKEMKKKEKVVKDWWKENKSFARFIEDSMFFAMKNREQFGVKEFKEIIETDKQKLPDGITYQELWKWFGY